MAPLIRTKVRRYCILDAPLRCGNLLYKSFLENPFPGISPARLTARIPCLIVVKFKWHGYAIQPPTVFAIHGAYS